MRYSIVRSGNAGVILDLSSGRVYKLVNEERAKSLERYISWYHTLSQDVREFLPAPEAIRPLREDLYLYVERLVRAPRYVPHLETLRDVAAHIVRFYSLVTSADGYGSVTNNMTYGNLLYDIRNNRAWIIDWQFFGKGIPVYEIVSFFESIYRYLFDDAGKNPSSRDAEYFWGIFSRSLETYISSVRVQRHKICEFLKEYGNCEFKHPSARFREKFEEFIIEFCNRV